MYYVRNLLVTILIFVFAYLLFVRPWILKKGTTPEERSMLLPGDDLVSDPNLHYTQAVTINSPSEVVWSYLIQVGYRRGGWYNWDFINGMSGKDYFYENNKSAARIIPELQNLKTNDKIYLTPQIGMDVHELRKNQVMVLTGYGNGRYLVAWAFYLRRIDANQTRFIVRWNSRLGEAWVFNLINRLVVEPGGVGIQQSLMLCGIKKRCEAESH
jgi:hypothetical protein